MLKNERSGDNNDDDDDDDDNGGVDHGAEEFH